MSQITDQQAIDAIKDAYNAGNWQQAYSLVYDALNALGDTPPAVLVWVGGALKVNSNSGAFASYIRDYTARQYELRTGEALNTGTSGPIQVASDKIAQRFVATLFGKLSDPLDDPPAQLTGEYSALTVPTLHQIGGIDAAAAASEVFKLPSTGNNYSPWAGTVLFTNLTDGSFFNDWVLTLGTSGQKKEPGTYDLISIAQATTELKTVGRLFNANSRRTSHIFWRRQQHGGVPKGHSRQCREPVLPEHIWKRSRADRHWQSNF